MSAITKKQEELVEALEGMKLTELRGLISHLEELWGVKAGAMAAGAGAGPGAAAAVEEKSSFHVVLKDAGASKINVIKVVRGLTGLGLKEAKALVDGAPSKIKEDVGKEEAEKMQKELEAAGATAVLE